MGLGAKSGMRRVCVGFVRSLTVIYAVVYYNVGQALLFVFIRIVLAENWAEPVDLAGH